MTQRTLEKWPSGDGWTICSVALTAEELAQRLGITFRTEMHDLGEVQEAVLWDRSVGQLVLRWFDHPSLRSTGVDVDLDIPRDEALIALWMLTRLDVRDFDWVNVHARCPRSQEAESDASAALLSRPVLGLGELTAREIEVFERATDGRSNREIGEELTIAASTVASYLQRVYLKLGISGRTELRAFRHPTPTAA